MNKMVDRNEHVINGIDLSLVAQLNETCLAKPAEAQASFRLRTEWKGGFRSEARALDITVGDQVFPRDYRIQSDEPCMLAGGDSAANPQELILSALNACMMVGYVANASLMGIKVRHIEIETTGALDLRGFLGVEGVPAGCQTVRQTVRVDADGSDAEWQEIHRRVQATSPNYFNFTRPIPVEAKLEKTA